jgi:acyl dehydratase
MALLRAIGVGRATRRIAYGWFSKGMLDSPLAVAVNRAARGAVTWRNIATMMKRLALVERLMDSPLRRTLPPCCTMSLLGLATAGNGDGPAGRQPPEGLCSLSPGDRMNLHVGQAATRSLKLTAQHVTAFAEMTGDRNPLHFDEQFAAKTKFGRLVVQGGLTTGLLHALVAMDLPGPGTVFLSQNWRFTAPVFIDDTITAMAEVLSVHATKPVTQLRIRVERQDGETVLDGEAWCYTFVPFD